MNPNINEKEVPTSTDNAPKQETIFADYDVTDMTGYDKNLKTARTYLYIVSAIQIGWGIFNYFKYRDDYGTDAALLLGGIDAGIGLIFLIFAALSYKKPVFSFLGALVFYFLVIITLAVIEPATIIQGIIMKVLVIIALIKGYKDAKEFADMKKTLGIGNSATD